MSQNQEDNTNDAGEDFYDSESEPSIIESSSTLEPVDSTKRKLISHSFSIGSQNVPTTLYAVQFSTEESAKKAEPCSRIFRNKENAMKLCKQDPENRTFRAIENSSFDHSSFLFIKSKRYLLIGIYEFSKSVRVQLRRRWRSKRRTRRVNHRANEVTDSDEAIG